jgi:hypothetical protein
MEYRCVSPTRIGNIPDLDEAKLLILDDFLPIRALALKLPLFSAYQCAHCGRRCAKEDNLWD